ncbi:methyltransferase family protein [Aneurinibacillus soli]|uniref:Malonyl-[acyl-carrier protein] O-methyltransferase n=1 Tax=Aneurinibacillus soli TaxID=1500254 RepID=A0A0U5BA62_9BACL|nr:class I SAM-dependent methyltransferase [Aneurinibacillus soli]PYE61640.1 methyltransferase family protein [Aneurinibacillus soli]BAU28502.1 Malonyl-[acyl-carrier protein] O-methyltransferase [Aneurinibacillus soli]
MALFDHSAETYDEWCATPLGSFVDAVEKQMMMEVSEPRPGEKALDIGCGTGIYSLLLASKGIDVTGVDISTAMLKKAREKAEKSQQAITFLEGDIHHLPFADHTFDLVMSNIVLEFVDSPEDVLAEAMRVVKLGGRLTVGMVGKQSEWAAMYEKQGKDKKESVFSGAHFFTMQEIKALYREEPSIIQLGLYIAPDEFVTKEQAYVLERQRSRHGQEEGAGFIVAKWIRKA